MLKSATSLFLSRIFFACPLGISSMVATLVRGMIQNLAANVMIPELFWRLGRPMATALKFTPSEVPGRINDPRSQLRLFSREPGATAWSPPAPGSTTLQLGTISMAIRQWAVDLTPEARGELRGSVRPAATNRTTATRLTSLDAYRGFIMLVMASAGFNF